MCTDLGPDIQDKSGNIILPALMAAMDDFANPRVQAHAAAAVVNFSEAAEPDVMTPHLDTLISKLLTLLQQVGLVASVLDESCQPPAYAL